MPYTAEDDRRWRGTLSALELRELQEDERRDAVAMLQHRRDDTRRQVVTAVERSRFARKTAGRPELYRRQFERGERNYPTTWLPVIRTALRAGNCQKAQIALAGMKTAIADELSPSGLAAFKRSGISQKSVRARNKELLRGIAAKVKRSCPRGSR